MSNNEFDDRRAIGAFREAIIAEYTPIVALKFPYNLNTAYVVSTTTGSGTTAQANSMAVISTTAAINSSASIRSEDVAIYQPGQGMVIRFTAIFTEGVAGSTQIAGAGDATDGYFIGYNGTEFGCLRRTNGVDTWTHLPEVGNGNQSSFVGKIDTTKGNVYQIQFQWLGFGQITYSIFDPESQNYRVLRREFYPNVNTTPSTFNPSFPILFQVSNTTNNTNIVLKTASAAMMVEGKQITNLRMYGAESTKSVTTEVALLTIRNLSTFASKTNRGLLFPDLISVAAEGTKVTTFKIYLNTTLGGTPSYSNVATNISIAEKDVAGTTVSGGILLAAVSVGRTGNEVIPCSGKIRLHPGDTITITAQSALAADASVSINWEELI